MKRIVLLMTSVSLLIMPGCSFNESEYIPEGSKGDTYKVSICGDISQQPATKVTTDGFCNGDQVGVYIVNYDGDMAGDLKLEGNQADNVRFTYDESGNWVSGYDVFYKDNDTKVDFYGYYPYAEPSSIEDYAFEVARDQSKGAEHGHMAAYEASDFLWAKTSKVTPTSSKVIMTFQHRMSSARVRFSQGAGWTDAAEYAAVAKEVLVTNTIRQSTIDLATGIVTPDGDVPLTGIVPMKDYDEFRAIVIPQVVPAGKTLLTLTIDGHPRNYSRDVDTEYLSGKITTYDLSISKNVNTGEYEIELKGVSVSVWEADNVSHGDDAREYVVVNNVIPGRLEQTMVERLEMDPTKIKNLKLTGKITTEDYLFMRDKMVSLQRLNLKEVESIVDGVYAIPQQAFYNKTSLNKCLLPDKLERIEEYSFGGTSIAGTLVLPEGLKYVSGFQQTLISNIVFPSTLLEIGNGAFSSCNNLMTEIIFPESLRIIGNGAFSESAITKIHLPESLEIIGDGAFSSCSSLSGSLVIPAKVKKIPDGAFFRCPFSGTLTLPEGLLEIGNNAFGGDNNALWQDYLYFKGELYLPKTVYSIGENAFAFTGFTGVLTLPSELIKLGSGAFEGCARLSGILEIPKNITSVSPSTFYWCRQIEGLKIHKNIETIGESAFRECFGMYSIVSEAKNPPAIAASAFNGVAKDNFTVEVPEASVNLYKNSNNWSEFKRISAYRDFSISRNMFRILNAEHSKTFLVRAPSGESWSVESKPDWVEVSPMNGVGKVDVTVTVAHLPHGDADRTGEIVFLLDDKDYRTTMTVEQYDYEYGDGDIVTLQEASRGEGVNIVIMGDCFDARDICEGKYLQAMRDACEYFFDIEPYLTYKDYFNVYGIFGMSPDSGMGTVNTIREARFGSQYLLEALVEPDFETIFETACLAPIKGDVSRTLVILIENSGDYGGITYLWGDGSAVAVVPMSIDSAPYDFRGCIHHDAGGHGFGKQGDEWIVKNRFIPPEEMENLNRWKGFGFYNNLSLESNFHSVDWSHLIYDPQYSNVVDVYEGGFVYSRGVFRSEPTSCMNNNIPYYSAISRESIVRRIKEYAGEEYSFEEFKANDKESLPSVATRSNWDYTEMWMPYSSLDHMPPKFMGEKPSFRKNAF